jgi:hypothetical protein
MAALATTLPVVCVRCFAAAADAAPVALLDRRDTCSGDRAHGRDPSSLWGMDVAALAISILAMAIAISAEIRARRTEIRFEVELDEKYRGRIVIRNVGTKTAKSVTVDPKSLAGVRYPANHLDPLDLIPGDKTEVWAEEEDHDQIPNTLRVRFGAMGRGIRAVKVPGDGRPSV